MQKYQILSKAGSGNFSDVYKARNSLNAQLVAIKLIKNSDDHQLTLKELNILAALNHPNIIKVKEVIKSNQQINIIFDYMEETLLELYQSCKHAINENQIKCILFQTAFALDHLHKNKFIHRDIKPENILINRKLALIKLIDFGLAKQDYLASTDYVATRWYRAPQNLLGLKNSSNSMDIFALGCVIAQLFRSYPLFPGQDTIDQLYKIIDVLGPPTMQNWPQGFKQVQNNQLSLSYQPRTNLKECLPAASQQLLDLLGQMLKLNPLHRITARQILQHRFFKNVQKVIPQHIYLQYLKTKSQYQSKKARRLSPFHYLPQQNDNTSAIKIVLNHQKKPPININPKQQFFNSSLTNIQSLTFRKDQIGISTKYLQTQLTNDHAKKQQQKNKNEYSYQNIRSPAHQFTKKDEKNKPIHYLSKDHFVPVPTISVQKRHPEANKFQNETQMKIQRIRTLSVEPKFNAQLNFSLRDPKQENIAISPRYKVKRVAEPRIKPDKVLVSQNSRLSIEPAFSFRNHNIQKVNYKPIVNHNFKKDFL